jgi:hypothetical protein
MLFKDIHLMFLVDLQIAHLTFVVDKNVRYLLLTVKNKHDKNRT